MSSEAIETRRTDVERSETADRVPAEETRSTTCLLGTCVDDRHPTLLGRVRIRWSRTGGEEEERWLPALQGLALRKGDRVLVQRVENWPEPVVTGVVDGFATRREPETTPALSVELKPDETVEVRAADGSRLLELSPGAHGPVVRIVTPDVDLDVPGRLRLKADVLEFKARRGSVRIDAGDDVVVTGEVIKLN